ncbi:phenylacetyl-CoA ligase [Mycena floridula]|nr:phenylacetyl-CoA ligase [Mycena floridula]
MEFRSPIVFTATIPDDLSIPQFIFDTQFPSRPSRPEGAAWLVEDAPLGRSLQYSEVKERTRALANGLKYKWNIGEDDVVCLLSPNVIDYPICVWAVHRLGGIITPVNPAFTTDELVYQLEATKASALLIHDDFLSTGFAAAERVGLSKDRIIVLQTSPAKTGHSTVDDTVSIGNSQPENYEERRLQPGEAKTKIAFLNFSSGTTGRPKAVCIPHYAVQANILQMAAHWRMSESSDPYKRMAPGGVCASVLPLFHIYGLVVTLHTMLFAGISVLVMPKFSFEAYLQSIVRHRVTHLFLVPPQVVLFVKHPATKKYDLNGVKYIMCGAAPLSGELLVQLSKIMPKSSIGQGYGLTETCTTVSILAHDQSLAKVGSAGFLLPGLVARVVKSDNQLAGEGEEGELVVKSPSNALRYLNNEVATKETFVDGWVRTGDAVIMKNNEIYITDRLKEIMKVRGFQVAPAELEGHLLLHPSVADVCVVGIPDDYSGELPFAYIVLEAGTKQEVASSPEKQQKVKLEISKHVSDVKVNYKWINGGIEFIEAIPKTPSGKILRRVLRDQVKMRKAPKAKL